MNSHKQIESLTDDSDYEQSDDGNDWGSEFGDETSELSDIEFEENKSENIKGENLYENNFSRPWDQKVISSESRSVSTKTKTAQLDTPNSTTSLIKKFENQSKSFKEVNTTNRSVSSSKANCEKTNQSTSQVSLISNKLLKESLKVIDKRAANLEVNTGTSYSNISDAKSLFNVHPLESQKKIENFPDNYDYPNLEELQSSVIPPPLPRRPPPLFKYSDEHFLSETQTDNTSQRKFSNSFNNAEMESVGNPSHKIVESLENNNENKDNVISENLLKTSKSGLLLQTVLSSAKYPLKYFGVVKESNEPHELKLNVGQTTSKEIKVYNNNWGKPSMREGKEHLNNVFKDPSERHNNFETNRSQNAAQKLKSNPSNMQKGNNNLSFNDNEISSKTRNDFKHQLSKSVSFPIKQEISRIEPASNQVLNSQCGKTVDFSGTTDADYGKVVKKTLPKKPNFKQSISYDTSLAEKQTLELKGFSTQSSYDKFKNSLPPNIMKKLQVEDVPPPVPIRTESLHEYLVPQEKTLAETEKHIKGFAWFHDIDYDEAKGRLHDLGQDGAFLVRPSSRPTPDIKYTIAVFHTDRILNFHIRQLPNGQYRIGRKCFNTISELIKYYQDAPLAYKGLGIRLRVTPLRRNK